MAIDWKDFYKSAKKNVRPTYKQLRKMDSDDWLASIGLERRNVAADVFGTVGLLTIGCGIGFALGMLFAPKRGEELRREWNEKLRPSRLAGQEPKTPATPGYAS